MFKFLFSRLFTRQAPRIYSIARSHFIPPDQYDQPIMRQLMPSYILKHRFEVIPVLVIIVLDVAWVVNSIFYASQHTVDTVFHGSHDQCRNISHTMDLLCPKSHKRYSINQVYEPWPRMQAVLDKMQKTEREAFERACEDLRRPKEDEGYC